MNVHYRIADSLADVVELLMLRVEVFVVEQEGPHDEEPDIHDKEATFVVADVDGTVVGTARFRRVADRFKIERIAVKKDFRRMGIGTGLVRFILNHIQDQPHQEVYLHAQTVARNFYVQLGFQPVGETFMEAGIEHIKMVRGV